MANTGKNVLYTGLRNSRLHSFTERTDKVYKVLVVSNYLSRKNLKLESLILKTTIHQQLDILASGSIPPNPSHLKRQEKTGTIFTALRSSYNYLLIDSAPSLLETDTFLITKYTDGTLYVVRAGHTQKNLLDFAVFSKEAFKHLGLIKPDVNMSYLGYGNKYG